MSAPVVLASGVATPRLILLALVDPLKSSSTSPTTRQIRRKPRPYVQSVPPRRTVCRAPGPGGGVEASGRDSAVRQPGGIRGACAGHDQSMAASAGPRRSLGGALLRNAWLGRRAGAEADRPGASQRLCRELPPAARHRVPAALSVPAAPVHDRLQERDLEAGERTWVDDRRDDRLDVRASSLPRAGAAAALVVLRLSDRLLDPLDGALLGRGNPALAGGPRSARGRAPADADPRLRGGAAHDRAVRGGCDQSVVLGSCVSQLGARDRQCARVPRRFGAAGARPDDLAAPGA